MGTNYAQEEGTNGKKVFCLPVEDHQLFRVRLQRLFFGRHGPEIKREKLLHPCTLILKAEVLPIQ